ncbi:MAG: TlpA disulfide reductase family protein [Cytophagales bacterium]
MKAKQIIVVLILASFSLATDVLAQKRVEVIKLETLFDKIERNNDTVYIVNFWATWCGPCVKELPDFERLNSVHKSSKMKMLLVSIDFKSDIGKVRNFVNKKMMNSEVVLLDEPKYNEWIDKIDAKWEGQIPVTLFYKNKQKLEFIGKQTSFEYLDQLLKSSLN